MSIRHYITLVESLLRETQSSVAGQHIWIAGDKHAMQSVMDGHIATDDRFFDRPETALETVSDDVQDDADQDDKIVLEFRIRRDLRAGDIQKEDDAFIVHDPDAVRFVRVWMGVLDDALTDDVDPDALDEVAIGGLKRCTSVTCNALFKFYHKPVITLAEVPETDVGVLEILSQRGLAYQPVPMAAGRTVQQFVALNKRGAFYLVTPGHAMALVGGELFDAENRGTDGRKIIAAYSVTTR